MKEQKKTVGEWNALVRVALLEVNDAIGNRDLVIEGHETVTFDEYRKAMEKIATEMPMAAAVASLDNVHSERVRKLQEKLP